MAVMAPAVPGGREARLDLEVSILPDRNPREWMASAVYACVYMHNST